MSHLGVIRNLMYRVNVFPIFKVQSPLWRVSTINSPVISKMCYSFNPVTANIPLPTGSEDKSSKARKEEHVTVINTDDSSSVMPLTDARRLADRRGFKLLRTGQVDRKNQTHVYRLMSGSDLLKDDIDAKKKAKDAKNKSGFKSAKIVTISSKITDHDLMSKISHINKLVERFHEVRVTVEGASGDPAAESIFDKIQKSVSGRILQKRAQETNLKFSVVPSKEAVVERKAS